MSEAKDLKQAMTERRYARLFVGDELVRNEPDKVQELLSKLLVLRCEFEFCRAGYVYDVLGTKFDPVPPGREPPRVYIKINSLGGRSSWLEFTGEQKA